MYMTSKFLVTPLICELHHVTDAETPEQFQIFTEILGDSSGLRKEDFRKIQGLFKTAMANCTS